MPACPTLLAQPALQGPVWVWEYPQMAQREAQEQGGLHLFGVLMFYEAFLAYAQSP